MAVKIKSKPKKSRRNYCVLCGTAIAYLAVFYNCVGPMCPSCSGMITQFSRFEGKCGHTCHDKIVKAKPKLAAL